MLTATEADGALSGIAALAVELAGGLRGCFALDDARDALRLVGLHGAGRRTVADLAQVFDQPAGVRGRGVFRRGRCGPVRGWSCRTCPPRPFAAGNAAAAESGLIRRLDLRALVSVPLRGAQGPVGALVVGWARAPAAS